MPLRCIARTSAITAARSREGAAEASVLHPHRFSASELHNIASHRTATAHDGPTAEYAKIPMKKYKNHAYGFTGLKSIPRTLP
mmetsp:Transcript_22110/g.61519  ORF Transcript_22110/g.61519 Transcript_22110/m.61519 type:complete len:83 (+) Transcript_22110:266-514(+)